MSTSQGLTRVCMHEHALVPQHGRSRNHSLNWQHNVILHPNEVSTLSIPRKHTIKGADDHLNPTRGACASPYGEQHLDRCCRHLTPQSFGHPVSYEEG